MDLLYLEHRGLQLAQLLQIARFVGEPSVEIDFGKPEPGFDLYRRRHIRSPTLQLSNFIVCTKKVLA